MSIDYFFSCAYKYGFVCLLVNLSTVILGETIYIRSYSVNPVIYGLNGIEKNCKEI